MVPIAFDGCFGWLHPGATDFGVVLCGPDGDEELNVRYLWLSFAEKLASAGMPTLRFDYRGTGDSIGDCWAPGQVRSWSDSVAGAVNWMRDQVGVKAVALVGLRLGAPLAVAASRELGNIDALVLLAPVVSGRTYARELRLRMKLDHALARARGRPEKVRRGGPTANEDVEAAGFVYTSETLADLESLNLLEVSRCPASRILILKRRLDTSTNERLSAHFRELGADVSEEEFVGYSAFMQPAQLAEYPRAAFDCVASWLKQFSPCRGAVSPPSTPQVQLEPSGCVDEPILFGKQLSLFGVVCRPPSVSLDVPVLMFLTTWWAPHVGQGRMWVTMARYFAQLGFTSLRLDVAGVGDSFVGLDKPNPSTRLENAIDDVQAALDWLQSKGHSRFVLIGLCWGALLARSVSLRDDRVSGQVLINLPPARETLRNYLWFVRDRLTRDLKSRWRILRREKKIFSSFKRLATVVIRNAGLGLRSACFWMWRDEGVPGVGAKESRDLFSYRAATLLVYNQGEVGLYELQSSKAVKSVTNVRLEVLEDGDHPFYRSSSRRRLTNLIENFITSARSPPHRPKE